MDSKQLAELREQYIKNPPEGMTAELVRNMTDSDLLDMHYFMTEDVSLSCPLHAGFLFRVFFLKEALSFKKTKNNCQVRKP